MAGGTPDFHALDRTLRGLEEESVVGSGGPTTMWAPDPGRHRGDPADLGRRRGAFFDVVCVD
jgi:hypothetical protein